MNRVSSFLAATLMAAACGAPAMRAGLSPEEAKIVAYIDAHPDDFPAELQRAVSIDSATENLDGVRQEGEYLGSLLTPLGFECHFLPMPESTGRAGHLVAERRGTKGKRLLLIGHLDTVFPGANFRREGSMVHGAGVADMKGGDLVIVDALRALASIDALKDTQIIVLMDGDEEAPGLPLDISRAALRDAAARSDVALAFESAIGSTATVARRGAVTWELEVQGSGGHSSGMFSPEVGRGSIYEAARILDEFQAQLSKIDGVTVNPATIVGGSDVKLDRKGGTVTGKANVIAKRTLVRGDVRFLSASQLESAKSKMQAIVQQNLPHTSAKLTFHEDGYPAMEDRPVNRGILIQLDRVSRDLGFGAITAFDPRGRGAGDIAFVSPPLPGLDGLGLGGTGEHSTNEAADLTPAPMLIKRAAILFYRLTR
ncbi:MAG TPA: M20/M25/M40 family metallo-hydrolase [Candidatus Didemnitutus sp.]|nr:M20/M25/M40 family metallo-hydrolase [Candidatus Didemnitutus sp.]